VRITRNLAGPVTFALLLAGAACGSPHSASASPPAARVVPTTTPATDNRVAPTTAIAVNPGGLTPADVDLNDVDRSLDELDRDLTDIRQALSQTREGDVDQ
jgi:hypothetical protein